jgi:hypothetical protein
MIYNDDNDDDNYNFYQQHMMNKAAGYVISKNIYEIRK